MVRHHPDADRHSDGDQDHRARHLRRLANFRHPVAFYRDVQALDDISDGRFLLGVGTGDLDAQVLGGPPLSTRERVDRFADVITHWPRPDGPYAGSVATLESRARDVIPTLRSGGS